MGRKVTRKESQGHVWSVRKELQNFLRVLRRQETVVSAFIVEATPKWIEFNTQDGDVRHTEVNLSATAPATDESN